MLWQYIGANFADSPRTKIMELLGYSATQVSSQLCPDTSESEGVTAEVLAEKMANLGTANVSCALGGRYLTDHVRWAELDFWVLAQNCLYTKVGPEHSAQNIDMIVCLILFYFQNSEFIL